MEPRTYTLTEAMLVRDALTERLAEFFAGQGQVSSNKEFSLAADTADWLLANPEIYIELEIP